MTLAEKVNVSACLSQAYARMKGLLFPFSLKKWITLGFCSWAVTLGESGSNSGNWDKLGKTTGMKNESGQTVLEMLNTIFWGDGSIFERIAGILQMQADTIQLIFHIGIAAAVFILLLAVVIAYFKGRMCFVWLDNLINNRAEVQNAYRKYEKPGVGFFKGKLYIDIWYYLISLLLWGITLCPGIQYLRESARMGEWGSFNSALASSMILGAVLAILNILVLFYLKLLFDFAPLIMYKEGLSFNEAWSAFNHMLFCRKIQFVKYYFFYWLVNLAAGVLLVLLLVCSCCILLFPLVLPVIGATMLLPWHVTGSYLTIEFYEVLTGE